MWIAEVWTSGIVYKLCYKYYKHEYSVLNSIWLKSGHSVKVVLVICFYPARAAGQGLILHQFLSSFFFLPCPRSGAGSYIASVSFLQDGRHAVLFCLCKILSSSVNHVVIQS